MILCRISPARIGSVLCKRGAAIFLWTICDLSRGMGGLAEHHGNLSAWRRISCHEALPFWIGATLFLSAQGVMADTDFESQKQRLVAAIEAAGCIVHENNHAAILQAANLTPEQGRAIVTQMMDRGEAEPLDDDLRLKTSGCP